MSSREEVKMWEEAAQWPLEMQPADAAAQSRAIRAGIVRGQKKSRRRLLAGSAGGLIAAAVLAAGLLLFNPAEWFQPPVAAVEEKVEWGTLELFKDNLFYDSAVLPYVLKHDYIQSIDQSAESKGFTINVNAVFADENVLTMLYTASTTTDYEIYNVSSSLLKDLSTGGISVMEIEVRAVCMSKKTSNCTSDGPLYR
ncbi:DUF4179 domain-containing protein [Paenibacillus donghaensis]|uniref:Uncharacterized protein n=1 Tax=Paenibacillus donghaensis TaxID=414771 RepID=A0A2Z2KDQ0_9BACL|nr:DUF4179 domain-containing protein [Paenibacillus donghaensis]ASA21163.1 hypothetical protein B9T62_10415 [Paenibacillus donghaensis]